MQGIHLMEGIVVALVFIVGVGVAYFAYGKGIVGTIVAIVGAAIALGAFLYYPIGVLGTLGAAIALYVFVRLV